MLTKMRKPQRWETPCVMTEKSREIVADYVQHTVGEREVVDWTRPDGKTYVDVPVLYLREVTRAEYLEQHPDSPPLEPTRCYFWEVSVD